MASITQLRSKNPARRFLTREQLQERSTREFIIPMAEWRLADPARRAAFTRAWDEIQRRVHEQAA